MTKRVLIFFLIVLVIIGSLRAYYKYDIINSLPNRACIIEYLKQTYGNDYTILYEYFGNSGASGRHDDYIIVEVNGIEFKVSALNKEIREDTYIKEKTDKILSEYIQRQCQNEVITTINYLIKCNTFIIDESEYKDYASHLDILQDSNLNISIMLCAFSDEPIGSMYQDLYELYLFMSNFKMSSITIRVDSPANRSSYLDFNEQRNNTTFYEYNELLTIDTPVSYKKFVNGVKRY